MIGAILLSAIATCAALSFPGGTQAAGGERTQQLSTQEKPWPPAGVLKSGKDVTAPRLIRDEKPKYTAEAMRNKIEGAVFMQAVIERTGRVGEVRVTRSLDREFGLDEQAVRAVRKWQFEPGHKNGVAVAVLVDIEMTFALRKD